MQSSVQGSKTETSSRESFALRFINDARDIPFLKLIALLLATVVSSGIYLFVPGRFSWWVAAAHVAVEIWFMGPFILMLHNTSHRRLFRSRYAKLNYVIPWVLGPFFGESPETYFAHHVGMHHPENNVGLDISATIDYRRDSALAFTRYFSRFFFFSLFELTRYFLAKKRYSLMARCLVGEASFFAATAGLLWWNWRAALVVFVIPFLVTRFGMMAGNWGQHAFVDQAAPANCYRNSITCINTAYNERCFNDGYHIGHHLKQTRHWTEMPGEYEANIARYHQEKAIVFTGIDFFGVWALLMVKNYNALARRVVRHGDEPQSDENVIALLKERTSWIRTA